VNWLYSHWRELDDWIDETLEMQSSETETTPGAL
jgi:hypothetical protein